MCFVSPILYVGWKLVKQSKVVKPEEADLVWERPLIQAYEAILTDNGSNGFWDDCARAIGVNKYRKTDESVAL